MLALFGLAPAQYKLNKVFIDVVDPNVPSRTYQGVDALCYSSVVAVGGTWEDCPSGNFLSLSSGQSLVDHELLQVQEGWA